MTSINYLTLPKDIVGYGTMRLNWSANPVSEEEAIKVLHAAYESGVRFFNAGEFYGELNLEYINKFFETYPELKNEILVSVKGAFDVSKFAPDGSKEGIKKSLDASLARLPKIDFFECARVDPNTPVEETLGYISEYIAAGKIKGVSLSEVSNNTIRRAAKVAKIAFVELEMSLWATEILHNGITDTCAELDIPIVVYSPVGSGFLSGNIKKVEDIPKGDFRGHFDKFQEENLKKNLVLLEKLKPIAEKAQLTLPQLSLAWIKFFNSEKFTDRAKYPEFVPIPGSITIERVKDNANIREISPEIFDEIQAVLKETEIAGVRYTKDAQDFLLR